MSVQDYGIAGAAEVCSPIIWNKCPMAMIAKDPSRFVHIWDDFVDAFTEDSVITDKKWLGVGTNQDIGLVADEVSGVIVLEGTGADDDSSFILSNALYDLTMNNGLRLWFEARVKEIAPATDHSSCIGLMEPTGCTAEGLADASADLIDEDFIGFLGISNATVMGDYQAVYQQGGDAAHTDVVASAHTPVADEFVKLGMFFDGKQTVRFYVNGAAIGDLDLNDLANESLDHKLAIFIGMKDSAASGFTAAMEIDWVRFACEKVVSGF